MNPLYLFLRLSPLSAAPLIFQSVYKPKTPTFLFVFAFFAFSHCFRLLQFSSLQLSLSLFRSASASEAEWRNLRQMRGVLRATWLQFCKLIKFSHPVRTSLREKAIAVAGRVTTVKDRESSKVSCPVCFDVMKASDGVDLRMTLALHLSLWHPDDVKLQWDIMQRKDESSVHLPSLIIGVGVAAGFGALVAISAKNRTQKLPVKVGR